MRRSVLLLIACVLALTAPSLAAAKPAAHHTKKDRRGGTVHKAWPRDKADKAPANPLAAWLAKQVGPVPVATDDSAVKRVDNTTGTTGTASARAAAATRTDRILAAASSVASGRNRPEPIAMAAATTTTSLALVRSFDIPTSDSSFNRLANLSWTYDNALAALGFMDNGAKSQAVQLLDQLQALQHADGSIAFAYDVATGRESGQIRTNALAWVGIAAVAYRNKYNDSRYDALIAGLAKYLLAEKRASDGLFPGGPDVTWVSTQHNLLAAEFLRSAGVEFGSRAIGSSTLTGTQLTTQYNTTAASIISKLLTSSGLLSANFVEGLNDPRLPVDVQSMGSMFLAKRNDVRAAFVGGYLSNYYLSPFTTNSVLWSGYKPFLGAGAPNIVWTEGTVQADWALRRLSIASPASNTALAGIVAQTNSGKSGPPGASATSNDTWGEYPNWPASAPSSWLLIVAGGGDILF
jgi:hypothetical protein